MSQGPKFGRDKVEMECRTVEDLRLFTDLVSKSVEAGQIASMTAKFSTSDAPDDVRQSVAPTPEPEPKPEAEVVVEVAADEDPLAD